jgi:hypothetical protein
LAATQPQRYLHTEDDRWQNLPASAYAEKLGLYYRIRLDTEIDWIKYRNRLFLKAYTQSKYQVDSPNGGLFIIKPDGNGSFPSCYATESSFKQ